MQIRSSLRHRSRSTSDGATTRLRVLTAAFGIIIAVVASRVAQVQAVLAGRISKAEEETRTVLEEIPASNGRIVSADGVVLAMDRTRFQLSVHYRWIEDPPDRRWLLQQARSRLAARDRRDPDRLKQATEEVLAAREDLWRSLSAVSGVALEDWTIRRKVIQQRVERMAQTVETRRQRRPTSEPDAVFDPDEPVTPEHLWRLVISELTSPPRREENNPIILKEELQPHSVAGDLPLAVAAAIESTPGTFPPGVVVVQRSSERIYPGNELAAHVIGVRRSPRSASENPRAGVGESGIEQSYDAWLRGRNGVRRVVYNRQNEVVDSTVLRPPVDGQDVTLSIVAQVQRQAEAILRETLESGSHSDREMDESAREAPPSQPRGGTIVAIDVATGDLVAAACAPTFNLNLFNEFQADEWNRLVNDTRRPFYPRVTAMTAPPGSVFKVLTAIAALEEGLIDPLALLHCQGYLDRPDQLRCMIYRQRGASHGDVTLSDALCESCNVYFFHAARRMGPEPLRRWSERFGFGAPTGADLPGEAAGRLPPSRPNNRDNGSTFQLAIGQSSLLVSPLQVARMMAAIANGGALVAPRFARVPTLPTGKSEIQLASFEQLPGEGRLTPVSLAPRTVAVLRESLERVVADPKGTGKSARVTGVRVAGKTGTAETGGGQPDHAWFAGYVPADRPRIAFVVMLEHAGSGGAAAGPVASRFVESLISAGLISRDREQSATGVPQPVR